MTQKTESKTYTPTPWTRNGNRITGGEYKTEGMDVSLSGRVSDPKMVTMHEVNFRVRNEADAAFIVRAVNSHEALLEAAKLVLKAGGYDGSGDHIMPRESEKSFLKLKAAISLAEGQ